MHGQDHFLEAVGIAVRGGGGGFGRVLGYVPGREGGGVDQADVHDVAVAGGDVPLAREVCFFEVATVAEYVEVWVPVGGLYAPFDFDRRKAARNPSAPPASPPELPERAVKTIQSIGERLRISGKCEGDKSRWQFGKPVAYPGGGEG